MRKQQFSCRRTFGWILIQKSVDNQAQTRIFRPLVRQEFWIGPDDRLVQLRGGFVFSSPRQLTVDDFINHDTKRPHVRRETVGVPEDDLRGRRLRGTEAVRLILDVKAGEALVGVFLAGAPSTTIGQHHSREAKVADDGVTVWCEKDVVDLQVPMKDVI
jgi:hypothetical protein